MIAKTALNGVTCYKKDKADDGYTLFSCYDHDVWLINMEGEIVHKWRVPYIPGAHMVLRPNGNLFYSAENRKHDELGLDPEHAGLGGVLLEIDWDSNLVWKLEVPYEHHDFEFVPENDNVIVATFHPEGVFSDEKAALMQGGIPGSEFQGKIWGDIVFEFNRDGEVVWEWKAWEHMDPELEMLHPLESRVILPYLNAVWLCKNGDLLLSARHVSTIFRVNRETGEIVKRYGRGELAHQHDGRELPNGNIMAFDNGIQRRGSDALYSRVVEFDGETGEIVWEYTAPVRSDFFSSICAGAERLSNGNTMISESMPGRVFEVTKDKEIVWEYINPIFTSYVNDQESTMMWRAHRYERDYPGLQGKTLDPANYPLENKLFGPEAFVRDFKPIII